MRIPLIVFLFSALLASPDAMSAAWTQAKNAKQFILTTSAYNSSRFYNDQEDSKKSTVDFTKAEVNPFFEYGVTDNLTAGLNATIQHWNFDKSVTRQSIYDFRQCGVFSNKNTTKINVYMAEAEIFTRYKLWDDNGLVLSAQPMIKTPCLFVIDKDMFLIENTMDIEMRLLGGYSFKWDRDHIAGLTNPFAGQYHFVNLEAAYRKRNEQFADQIRVDGTAGFRLSDKTLLLGQIFTVFSNGEEPIRGSLDLNGRLFTAEDSFHSVKAQFSTVHQITKRTSLQFSLFKEVMGKNSGNGSGVSLGLWFSF